MPRRGAGPESRPRRRPGMTAGRASGTRPHSPAAQALLNARRACLMHFPDRLPRLAAVLGALAIVAAPLSAQQLPQTWQEEQNFRSGPTPFEPLMEFWYELDAMSELVSMQPLTETLLGREMNLIRHRRRSDRERGGRHPLGQDDRLRGPLGTRWRSLSEGVLPARGEGACRRQPPTRTRRRDRDRHNRSRIRTAGRSGAVRTRPDTT